MKGYRHSPESRAKISAAQKGQPKSPEHRASLSAAMMERSHSPETRFLAKVDKKGPDECWNWTGYCNSSGYGRFKLWGGTIRAHRFAYSLDVGFIPDDTMVLHNCEARADHTNACVNPAHLYLGTAKQNSADAEANGNSRLGKKHSSETKAKMSVAQKKRFQLVADAASNS